MRTQANWARIVVVIFTLAVFYASVCSTSCAAGFCPNQQEQSSSHDCEQSTQHHSHHSGNQSPEKPDCAKHLHPSLFLVKAGDLQQSKLTITGDLSGSDLVTSPDASLALTMSVANTVDLAPPIRPGIPLYEQISVLRI